MDDIAEVTKTLDDVVLTAADDEGTFELELERELCAVIVGMLTTDLVQPSVVLESFTQSLLKYRDPVMREAFLESTLEVLQPRGDERDAGRVSHNLWSRRTNARTVPIADTHQLAVLKDSALTCISPFLPLTAQFPAKAKAVLQLIAEHADPRDVALALNEQLTKFAEQADPYAVSDSDDESEHEDNEIDWETAFPQVEEILDMYAIGE